jgi:hypothetical protein
LLSMLTLSQHPSSVFAFYDHFDSKWFLSLSPPWVIASLGACALSCVTLLIRYVRVETVQAENLCRRIVRWLVNS